MASPIDILHATQKYNFYSSTTVLVIGIVGNLLNILVFTSLKLFRNNQFALYLIVEAVANVFQLSISFLIQSFIEIYGSDVGGVSLFWCKFRGMMVTICTLVAFSSICFSAVDQCLSTSHDFRLRRLSTIKLARILILTSIIISLLHAIPFAVFLEIRTGYCTVFNPYMSNYLSYFYYPVLSGLLPVVIASMLSVLAYRNVRRIVSRRVPLVRRRLDQQLTAMVLVRIIVFVLFTPPYTIQRMYSFITKVNSSDLRVYSIVTLISGVTYTFFHLNYALPLYIFLATSSRFRRQVKHVLVKMCWRRCKRWCSCSPIQVHPDEPARSAASTDDLE